MRTQRTKKKLLSCLSKPVSIRESVETQTVGYPVSVDTNSSNKILTATTHLRKVTKKKKM